MPTASISEARSAAATQPLQNRPQSNLVLYDGSQLNVDYATYLAQHDVVYHAPPLTGGRGMPLGDGDLGAMLWCPEWLQFQLQKSDLWADPADNAAPASEWTQPSAGTVSIHSEPSFLQDPSRYLQRLSLHSGVITIESDNVHGACQVTTFMSASAGVLVVHYRDQSVRGAHRRVDVTLQRDAHLFALGETIGILQAFRDRRYALLARVAGAGTRASNDGPHRCSLVIDPTRSTEFTLYVAVATSPRNGDPVAMARSRIDAAMAIGFDRLLAEQRQHWSLFWEKSFLRLYSPTDDPLPGYLENLWYLALYQQACCSRGYDAPLANGGLWLGGEDSRDGPAAYAGEDLRALLASLIPSNHLELSVPYVDTYFRMLPELAAQTGSDLGMPGARFPARFNRFGGDLAAAAPRQEAAAGAIGPIDAAQILGEGLETGLLVWEAWRHAPDTFFLRERAYPLLRASAEFAIERCQSTPALWGDPTVRARVAAALRALLWADDAFGFEDEMRPEWERVCKVLSLGAVAYCPPELEPFGTLTPEKTIGTLESFIGSMPQQPCGLFGADSASPDVAASARLCAGLSAILLSEGPAPAGRLSGRISAPTHGIAGAAPTALHVFRGLPRAWSGAFSLAAPGGFRVSAEAVDGCARYVAVKSYLGGHFRLLNPWGTGERARVLQGRIPLFETADPIIEFIAETNSSYLIEPYDQPLSRSVSVRLVGRPNQSPKVCGPCRIGIPAAVPLMSDGAQQSRLPGSEPAPAAAMPGSRLDRRRAGR